MKTSFKGAVERIETLNCTKVKKGKIFCIKDKPYIATKNTSILITGNIEDCFITITIYGIPYDYALECDGKVSEDKEKFFTLDDNEKVAKFSKFNFSFSDDEKLYILPDYIGKRKFDEVQNVINVALGIEDKK